MQRSLPLKTLSSVLCGALVAVAPAVATENITCFSSGGRYSYCSARTDSHVRLVRQVSRTQCRQYDNWGYDRNGVWVDRGCSAEFEVGRDGRHGGGSDNDKDLKVAAGAVAGIALIAALASKNKAQDQKGVSSWAVGTFRGYDSDERVDLEVTILPGGSVTGFADGRDFTGSLDGNRLRTGRHEFRIERAGNGFEATDVGDSRHRVNFQRTGSGY